MGPWGGRAGQCWTAGGVAGCTLTFAGHPEGFYRYQESLFLSSRTVGPARGCVAMYPFTS